MASQIQQLHFLLVPLMSQSHLIPFIDLAKNLANRSIIVTIMITPLNAVRFESIITCHDRIQFLSLPFPGLEFGLPEGCENMDLLPSSNFVPNFFKACDMLQYPLEKWLGELESQPNSLISDICFPWTSDVALKFNIPRLVFHGISVFTLLCSHNIHRSNILDRVESDSEKFLVPDMPERIELTMAQMPMKRKSNDSSDTFNNYNAAEKSAQGIVVNTFEELEHLYVKEYRKVVKDIWCVGPLSLRKSFCASSIDEPHCLKWLNSMKPSSVIYVCFGSLCHLSFEQLTHIGLGLESSNSPFIWVIRKGDYSTEMEKWLMEERFEERIDGRGLIIRGWAPQVLILSHQKVGGFLTHCGWNSALEGVSAGLPMITWPMFAEQFYNEKLIVQSLKIGVRIGVEACVKWGEEEENNGVLVNKEQIKKVVDELMDEREEGEERRKRAREIGKMANRVVEEGGSSWWNMTMMIEHIMKQVTK